MVLRKHLIGATITAVNQIDFDRIIVFDLEGMNDLGDRFNEKLIVEIMGRRSNVILVNEKGVIIDAIRHVDSDINSFREILPARVYAMPPKQDKKMPGYFPEVAFDTSSDATDYLMKNIMGFSKPLCEAIVSQGIDKIQENLKTVYRKIEEENYSPFIYNDFSDFHVDFPFVDKENMTVFSSVSEMLEEFYREREIVARAKNARASFEKILDNNIKRIERKIALYQSDIKSAEGFDNYRILGDLLASNIFMLKGGEESLVVQNFYSENMEEVSIPLDPHKNGAWNIQQYYKRYRKGKSKTENCLENISKATDELDYLLSVRDAMLKATQLTDIDEIRCELAEQGYIKQQANPGKKRPPVVKKPGYLEVKVSDGFVALVGKNNIQNDNLTLKVANPSDLWFHVKNAPGSHVILRTSVNNGEYTQAAILDAARLAAKHSSLSESGAAINVDFTRAKHVKKPSGARPGKVIYTNEKTIVVKPD